MNGQVGDQERDSSTLFSELVLFVRQKPKFIIELDASSTIAMVTTGILFLCDKMMGGLDPKNVYAVLNKNNEQVAAVVRVSQNTFKKVMQVWPGFDYWMTHKFQVVDLAGRPLLSLTMSPAGGTKSEVVVADDLGNEVGQIVQRSSIGKIRFGLHAGGRRIGSLEAENWMAWDFGIADQSGVEVARITKTRRTIFNTASNDYDVQVRCEVDDPLRSLMLASALCVDILRRDAGGGRP